MTNPITATRLRALVPGYPPIKCADAHRVVAEHGGQVEESTVTLHASGVEVPGEWRPAAKPVGSLGEQPHDPDGCHRDGRPHLGPCDGGEVERPRKALQVCEHVVVVEIPDAALRAFRSVPHPGYGGAAWQVTPEMRQQGEDDYDRARLAAAQPWLAAAALREAAAAMPPAWSGAPAWIERRADELERTDG